MFSPGNLLYFNPFIFPDGGVPKPKYFLVLAEAGDDVLLASLPTSKDHVRQQQEFHDLVTMLRQAILPPQ